MVLGVPILRHFRVCIETNPGRLELPLSRINFHDLSLLEPLKFYCIYVISISMFTGFSPLLQYNKATKCFSVVLARA